MKAFLVNRIGDIGFLFGIFLTYRHFGTVSFTELRDIIGSNTLDAVKLGAIGWITLCLFIGATGKSAQLPLYVWLPDAMAGRTAAIWAGRGPWWHGPLRSRGGRPVEQPADTAHGPDAE